MTNAATAPSAPNAPNVRLLARLAPYVRRYAALGVGSLLGILVVDAAQILQPYLVKLAIDTNVAQRDLAGLTHTALLIGLTLVAVLLTAVAIAAGFGFSPARHRRRRPGRSVGALR